jgi:hypothetical protein
MKKILPYGGSAISSETAEFIINFLREKRPKNILEFGSGTSTFIFADYAKNTGAKVTSLEHLKWAKEETLDLLGEYSQYVDLRHAPIDLNIGQEYQSEIPLGIDFVLIDGPPAYGGHNHIGREKTLPQVYNHLANSWDIFIDDADREHEKNCIKNWQEKYDFYYKYIPVNKGLFHLTKYEKDLI